MTEEIKEKLTTLASLPGVYLMKDVGEKVIYVGKAGNLKKRLNSYFTKNHTRPGKLDMKTAALVNKISTFETIITGSEKEALILESNLIKRYKPRYNVVLKDDKRYPSLGLDIRSPYPNLNIVRKTDRDNMLYFGPFASSKAVYQTLKIIHKTFKLRKCKTREPKNKSRPCLNYQIGSCLAPCCRKVDQSVYNEIVKEVVLFLKGRTPDLIKKIKKEMMSAAEVRDYERAAVLRDKLYSLEKTLEKQVAVTTDFKDRDVIGYARSSGSSLIMLLNIRGGFLLGKREYSFSETLAADSEIISTFIRQYYEKNTYIPGEILIPSSIDDALLLEDWLKSIKERKVSVLWPQRGEKACLVKLAVQNAENSLKDQLASERMGKDILLRLQKQLKIERIPLRIECFDNSNISGSEPVAGMVVFEKGKPNKAEYRKYRIKTVSEQDDYAYMAEVLKRRYARGEESKPYPDLLMVDGGKGQLNIALSIVRDLNLEGNFEIIGIAKKDEKKGETDDKIFKPGRSNPIGFGRAGDLLLFLQSIRDEAHRFAISFHRQRRSARSIQSALDTIPGIGKKRKTLLLKHFGSLKRIRAATIEELIALPGIDRGIAESLKEHITK